MILAVSLAFAARVHTFEPDPRLSGSPFSGLVRLVADPVQTRALFRPLVIVPPSALEVPNGAGARTGELVFTNPTDTWAWLEVGEARVGALGAFGTARLEGIGSGIWGVTLVLPSGLRREFAVRVEG